MAKFTSTRYPHVILQDADGIWARFADGEFETDDSAVADRLRGLPEEEGVTEIKTSTAKAPAKTAAPKTAPKE